MFTDSISWGTQPVLVLKTALFLCPAVFLCAFDSLAFLNSILYILINQFSPWRCHCLRLPGSWLRFLWSSQWVASPKNSSSGLFLLLTLAAILENKKSQLCLINLYPWHQILFDSHFIFIAIMQGHGLSRGENGWMGEAAWAYSAETSAGGAAVMI